MATIIQSFEAKELKKRPFAIKIADKLTSFFGSVWFLVFNISLFALWITANRGKIPGIPQFDPYPYFFLTTGVSLEAIILTVIVLISQQRQNQVTKIREELDMQVNRIAEKEITKALSILKEIAEKQGIKLKDRELEEMLKTIEISYIERKLQDQLEASERKPIAEIEEKIKETIAPKK